jgi:hypothetical protein
VDEAAEAVAAVGRGGARRLLFMTAHWWQQLETAVRPLAVVVLDEHTEDVLEMGAIEDQQPVQAYSATAFALGARTGVLTLGPRTRDRDSAPAASAARRSDSSCSRRAIRAGSRVR